MAFRAPRALMALCVSLLFSTPFLAMARADGGVIMYRRDGFSYLPETEQYAILDHEDGFEDMLISIGLERIGSNSTAWILPLPSIPEDVMICRSIPRLSGEKVKEVAREDMRDMIKTFSAVYAGSITFCGGGLYLWLTSLADTSDTAGTTSGVRVHFTVTMYGYTVETITADSGEDIYGYLSNRSLDVGPGMISQLDSYVDKGYAFVVSWLSGAAVGGDAAGLVLRFPVGRMFYPMVLTSAYGAARVPLELLITDYVTPRLNGDLVGHTDVTYYRGGSLESYDADVAAKHFIDGIYRGWNGYFTRVAIDAPASDMKKDLWFDKGMQSDMSVQYAAWTIERENELCGLFAALYLMFSLLAGFLSGMLVFGRKSKKEVTMCCVLSLSHFAGILTLLLFSFFMFELKKMPRKHYLQFCALFLGLFFVMMFGTLLLMWMPLL